MNSISVIIPVKDDEVRLRECVRLLTRGPIASQPKEVIVVDNGSREPVSPDWFPSPIVKVLQCPEHGSYAARNVAIAAATGDILAFTDSDCVPADDWVTAGSEFFAAHDVSIVAGRIFVFPRDARNPTPEEYYEMLFAFPQAAYVEKSKFGVTANLFVRRRVFDQVGLFDHQLHSGGDREWGQRASRRGYVIHYADAVAVRHPARRTFAELTTKTRRVARGLVQGGDSLMERTRLKQIASSGMPPIRNMAYCVVKSRGAPLITRVRTSSVILRLHFENKRALRAALDAMPGPAGFDAKSHSPTRTSTDGPGAGRISRATGSKPRLLVAVRAFDRFSEVWIQRQIAAFRGLETSVLSWDPVLDASAPPPVPVHVLDADFDHAEQAVWRWGRRLLSFQKGNLHGTVGKERKRIETIVRQAAPDVILCHFGHTALRMLPVADSLRVPLVAHFHGVDISSSLRDRYYRWSLARSAQRFAACIVVGSHQKRTLSDLGVPDSAISLIPCGAPTDQFTAKTDYRTPGCTFIAVSRLVPWKGLDVTIRAFSRARRAQPLIELHIVGAGSMEALLRRLVAAEDLGQSVVFHGAQPPEEVQRLMRASDVFLQHSLDFGNGWTEGFGVSITEASACGLPVLVTDSGGIKDQVTDGENGLITPQRDADAMAEAMVRLATDQGLRERLGKAGHERAISQFDSTVLAHKLEERLLIAAGRDRSDSRTVRQSDSASVRQ